MTKTSRSQNKICFRCGISLKSGELYYDIDLKIASGFNGYLPELTSEDDLDVLLSEIESMSSIEVEEDVYKEMKFLLCENCKDELIKSIVGEVAADSSDKKASTN